MIKRYMQLFVFTLFDMHSHVDVQLENLIKSPNLNEPDAGSARIHLLTSMHQARTVRRVPSAAASAG